MADSASWKNVGRGKQSMRRGGRILRIAIVAACGVAVASDGASAASAFWVAPGNAAYDDPASWSTGAIPNAFQTPYPPYTNRGTSQPKFDARVDQELAEGRLTYSGGVATGRALVFDMWMRSARFRPSTNRVRPQGDRHPAFTPISA